MLLRRTISLITLALVALVFYATAPLLLLVGLVLGVTTRYRTLPHALAFALGFLFFECTGVSRLTWLYLRYRNSPDYIARNQRVQYWWARGLLRLGVRIYSLDVQISGRDAIEGPSALVIARHTSIADTILPMVYFAEHRGEGMRYILKRELMVMPCLDIAGHRLPNLFVDRSGMDTARELDAVRFLTMHAGEHESVLIYPEGTRFTPEKHARLRAAKPELLEQLDRWPDLLPPRLGGVSAMLAANPGKDVVFLAHTGFEGSASLTDLVNGSWRKQIVRLHFWRIRYADIPADHEEFLFENWDEMQDLVSRSTRHPN